MRQATSALHGLTVPQKNELLFQLGVNFNETPLWQRRGLALYYETYEKPGIDPRSFMIPQVIQAGIATSGRRE